MVDDDFLDWSGRLLFDHPRMVEDLLRGFLPPGAVDAFDFSTLERLPADRVADDPGENRGDAAWRVRVREGGSGSWLYLLCLLELPSTVDHRMAARVLARTGRMYLKLLRSGEMLEDGLLPPVLPIVFYNGKRPWSAAVEVRDLIAPVGPGLAAFQPRQRYHLIDAGRLVAAAPPADNVASASGGVSERRGSRTTGRSFAERMEAFAAEQHALGAAEGREQGLEQSLERERKMLRRQAARRFGAEVAEQLASVLRDVRDAERLAEIGEDVIDCADGEALLARARGAGPERPNPWGRGQG